MAVIVALEARFGIRMPLEGLILDGATVQALAAKIDALHGQGADSTRVVKLRAGGGRAPLFAAHVAGGHLSDYLGLAHIMHSEQPLWGLHPRGLDGKTAPPSTMADLAADAVDAMRQHTPDRPYRLIGYSFGGVVAFEMARQLLSAGEAVSHLILLDPFVTWKDSKRLLRTVARPLKAGDPMNAWARATRVVPAAMGLRQASNDLNEAHRTALLRYRPAALTLPKALLISAAENPGKTTIQSEWRALLGKKLSIVEQPSDHPNLVREPAVWSMAQAVEAFLHS